MCRQQHGAHLAPSLYLALLIPTLSANPHAADSRSVDPVPITVATPPNHTKSHRQSPESSLPEHRFRTGSRSKFAPDHSATYRFEGSSPSLPEQNPQRIWVASSVPDTITRAKSVQRDDGNITARGATPRSKLAADMSAKARRATAAASIEGRMRGGRRAASGSGSIPAVPIIRRGTRAPGAVFAIEVDAGRPSKWGMVLLVRITNCSSH